METTETTQPSLDGLGVSDAFGVSGDFVIVPDPAAGPEATINERWYRLYSHSKAMCELMVAFNAELEPGYAPQGLGVAVHDQLSKLENLATAARILITPAIAATGEWKRDGAPNPERWFAGKTGKSPAKARAEMETGKNLENAPGTRKAFLEGEISAEQADTISDVADVNPEAEQALLDAAKKQSLKELKDEAARRKAEVEDIEQREQRIHKKRYLRTWTDREGAWNLHAKGTIPDGADFMSVLERLIDQQFKQARKNGVRGTRDNYCFDALMNMGAQHGHGTPGPADPGEPGPTDTDPGDPGPADTGPTDPGPKNPGPTGPGPTNPGATSPPPASPRSTKSGSAGPSPSNTEPASRRPSSRGTAKPGPSDTEATIPGPVGTQPNDPGPTRGQAADAPQTSGQATEAPPPGGSATDTPPTRKPDAGAHPARGMGSEPDASDVQDLDRETNGSVTAGGASSCNPTVPGAAGTAGPGRTEPRPPLAKQQGQLFADTDRPADSRDRSAQHSPTIDSTESSKTPLAPSGAADRASSEPAPSGAADRASSEPTSATNAAVPRSRSRSKPPISQRQIYRVDWAALVRGRARIGERAELRGFGPVSIAAIRGAVAAGTAKLLVMDAEGRPVTVAHLGTGPINTRLIPGLATTSSASSDRARSALPGDRNAGLVIIGIHVGDLTGPDVGDHIGPDVRDHRSPTTGSSRGDTINVAGLGEVSRERTLQLLGAEATARLVTRGQAVHALSHEGRAPNTAQRVALAWSDTSCKVEGCPNQRVEIDHRHPWASERVTELDNLDPLCSYHHSLKTNQGWRFIGPNSRVFVGPESRARHA